MSVEDQHNVPVQQSETRKISRRSFIRHIRNTLAGLAAATLSETKLARSQTETVDLVGRADLPPTIMFHAREKQRRILPGLIEQLQAEGYTFITYRQWYESIETSTPIEKPIILTFDDITFVHTSQNFHFYAEVVELLKEKGVSGVFGVITQPVVLDANNNPIQLVDQDEEYWQAARSWVDEGVVEFATHTESHPNLDNPALTPEDFVREIAESANLIEQYTGHPVISLITPYGSGVTQEGLISTGVLHGCQSCNIRFVIGIPGMRKPEANTTENGNTIYAVGRIQPIDSLPEAELTTMLSSEVTHWTEANHEEV